ncbi:MAG: O-antigen ligase family protein [Nitrospinota bacterium]|nr:O-antigen ligase family protein [Nitrospinota bacterium]
MTAGLALREFAEGIKGRPPLSRLSMVCLIGYLFSAPFSISISQIFVFTGIASWLVSLRLEGGPSGFQLPLWRPIALLVALTLISAAFSDDPGRSLKDAKQLFQVLIFYFALNTVLSEREALWLVKALLSAAAVASVFTLGVAFMQPVGLANRMSGFFSIYMTLGGYLVIAGAMAVSYFITSEGSVSKGLAGAASIVIIAALMSTFSRNAWIGFGAAALCAALVARSIKGIVLIASLTALVLIFSPASIRDRLFSIGDMKDPSTRERVFMWKSGMEMVRDRPLLGTGLDMIKRTYSRYANPEAMKKRTGHLHNNPLHIAAERGIPGFVAWMWFMGAFFVAGVRRLKGYGEAGFERRYLSVAGLSAITGFFIAGLFEYNYGDSEVVMLAYFVMSLPFMGARETESTEGG